MANISARETIPREKPLPQRLLRFHFDATPETVRATLEDLHGRLLSEGVDSMDCNHVQIVLAEVLNNIVEHAYRDHSGGSIRLFVRVSQQHIRLELIDQGGPMPNLAPPLPIEAPDEESLGLGQDLAEGGYGWHLIHTLADRLDYRRTDPDNRLQLCLTRSL